MILPPNVNTFILLLMTIAKVAIKCHLNSKKWLMLWLYNTLFWLHYENNLSFMSFNYLSVLDCEVCPMYSHDTSVGFISKLKPYFR